MLKYFKFTDKSGSSKPKYRTLDDVEEIKHFAENIEQRFDEHIHKDHSGHPTKCDKPCSYINYNTYGEVTFPQTKLIKNEVPLEYHLIGDRVTIFLKNIINNENTGVKGYVKLVHLKQLDDFNHYIELIKDLCEHR